MKFLSLVSNSFGCSASGERLVSAARDGDLQEAKALLEYNPRLARYSTFGVRNSPLHYSAAQGHHEIVSLLLESGVDINLRNYRGQTALMQACQYGHWEVVLTLVLFKANMHRADYLNGGTALHLAALNGHSRCIRILLADYIPSVPNFCNILSKRSRTEESIVEFDRRSLYQVINSTSDGGITALHMAALNGHVDSVHLLIELGASVSEVTVEDGTTIDLIGLRQCMYQVRTCLSSKDTAEGLLESAGSTPLHYAACGGNAQCCQILIAKGASLTAVNANGWTPLAVAHSWHRDGLEDILTPRAQGQSTLALPPSPYLCLPFMSIVKIARECGWRSGDSLNTCLDPCVVCLERKCTVAAEGCYHEFCTRCALYLCSTNCTTTVAHGPPGSIACPLCRHGIVSFVKLEATSPMVKDSARTSLSLSFCTCTALGSDTLETPFCKPDVHSARFSPNGSSFRSLSCHKLSSLKMNPSLCMGASDSKCLKSSYRRSTSINSDRAKSWLCSLHQCVATGIDY